MPLPPPGKRQNFDISRIMQEQVSLLKTEKELCGMIDRINDQLNQLLIEELQLKSNQISLEMAKSTPSTSSAVSSNKPLTIDEIKASLDSKQINQQMLNLDAVIKKIEDELEEDDDDDEYNRLY